MEKNLSGWIKKLKNMKKDQWFILVLIGILIAVIAIPIDSGTDDKQQKEEKVQEEEAIKTYDMEELEKRVEQALSKVAGVGKVQVMLTRKSSGEKIVEKDAPVTDNITSEEDSEGGKRNTSEHTIGEETVYTQDGSGGQTPYVIEELEPQIAGVVVVAEGGDNSAVVQDITEAIMALFGVEVHKIKVMKMN